MIIVKKNPLTGSYYVDSDYGLPKIYNATFNRSLPKWIAKRIAKTEPKEENGFLIWILEGRKEKENEDSRRAAEQDL